MRLILVVASAALLAATPPRQGFSLWPAPASATLSGDPKLVQHDTFTFGLAGGKQSPLLAAAFARYEPLVFPHVPGKVWPPSCPPPR